MFVAMLLENFKMSRANLHLECFNVTEVSPVFLGANQFVSFKIFLNFLDVSTSLQLHVSDRPYNSMSRTLGLTRATEIGSRRLTTNAENLSKKNENKNVKKWIFKNNRLYSEFF